MSETSAPVDAPRRRFTLPKPFAVVVLIALCIIPLLYAATLIWANDDPTGNIDSIPAAIVNADSGAAITDADGDTTDVHLGDEVVDAVVDENGDSIEGFGWTVTDADTAAAGLADGTYLAVLTIPEDFSVAATSSATVDPDDADAATQGVLGIATNDATNYIIGNIAASLGKTVAASLAENVSATYLDNVYLGFTSIHDSIAEAADGAGALSDGTTTLADGATTLDDGLQEMVSATSALPAGASALTSGVSSALTGSQSLSSGLEKLRSGSSTLADGAASALSGSTSLSAGLEKLGTGTASLADGASAALSGAQTLSGGLDQLSAATPALASGASSVSDGLDQLIAGYDALTDDQRKELLAQLATGADAVEEGAATVQTSAVALASGAQSLVGSASSGSGLAALSAGAVTVQDGAATAVDGASSLVSGLDALSSGAADLRDGTATAADGSSSLVSGLSQLSTGASQLGVKLTSLTDAIGSAADGSASLSEGAQELDSGAQELSDGLTDGLDQIPTYTDGQASTLSETAATPVTLDDTRENEVAGNGTGLTPYFLSLGLWIGTLAVFFMRPALNERLLRSRTPFPLVALRSYLPNAIIAIVQSVLAVLVVHAGVGIDMANLPGVFGLAALASLTFMAINQALIALLGAPGRFVGLLFVVLQLAAAGGTYPIQTAAPFFQALHDWLPLTDAVQSFRVLIAGGDLATATWAWSLVAWMLGALLLTVLAAFLGKRRAAQDGGALPDGAEQGPEPETEAEADEEFDLVFALETVDTTDRELESETVADAEEAADAEETADTEPQAEPEPAEEPASASVVPATQNA